MQKFFAETGSNSPGKFEFLPFIKTHQQRAKMFPASFGVGVSADDEFLLLVEFDFDPRSGALSGLIPGSTPFANQAFKAQFPSSAQEHFNVFCERDRIANHAWRLV